jgi:hypothetical protein
MGTDSTPPDGYKTHIMWVIYPPNGGHRPQTLDGYKLTHTVGTFPTPGAHSPQPPVRSLPILPVGTVPIPIRLEAPHPGWNS